jgi:hypothetical protein
MKAVILGGFRHTVESPRFHYPEAELWLQSTSARAWQWTIYDWSRWFDIHAIDPDSFYPGIRSMRPDVLDWYHKQGSERPIYFTRAYREILASRAYPIEAITAQFGADYFGCQLDYMGALALHEGFDRWILYGVGQPYVADRTGEKARHWFAHHGTFLHWLRLATARGVEIVLDTPASNMFSLEMIADEEQYPTPPPLTWRYGYDMGVERDAIRAAQMADYAVPA